MDGSVAVAGETNIVVAILQVQSLSSKWLVLAHLLGFPGTIMESMQL